MRSDRGLPGITAVSKGFLEGPPDSMVKRMGWPTHHVSRMIQKQHKPKGNVPFALAPSNCLTASAASSLLS